MIPVVRSYKHRTINATPRPCWAESGHSWGSFAKVCVQLCKPMGKVTKIVPHYLADPGILSVKSQSGHLLGICLPQGAHPGRHPAVSAESMDQGDGAPGQSRRAQSVPGLSHASPVGLGDAGGTQCLAPAEVDGRG